MQHGISKAPEAKLPAHFNGTGNIGILLGDPSGGLVDVDLDCPEAHELAEQHLPPTGMKTGRPGSPASHWWYIAPGARTKQRRDPIMRGVRMTDRDGARSRPHYSFCAGSGRANQVRNELLGTNIRRPSLALQFRKHLAKVVFATDLLRDKILRHGSANTGAPAA